MSGIAETLIIIAATKLINIGIDYGIKRSKSTKNTVDDYIFSTLGHLTPLLKFITFKRKKT